MYISLSEVKQDNETIISQNFQSHKGCEVVIKRSNPPKPVISITDAARGKMATIMFPDEILSNSLNGDVFRFLK